MKLLLIRHGQSEWNASGRWQGQADPPLTELGKSQASEAAETLHQLDLNWEGIHSSDLERARVTATTIASRLGLAQPIPDPAFRERDAGEWSGLTKAEIDEQYPGFLDEGKRPPCWESGSSLFSRVAAGIQELVSRYPQDAAILLVAHGGVLRELEETLLGKKSESIPNLGARWFQLQGESIEVGERIELVSPDKPDHSEQI